MNKKTIAKIKKSLTETRQKRKLQVCKVIDLKVNTKKLNKKTLNELNMYFIEAKWFYNYILSQDDPYNFNYQTSIIKKMNKNNELVDVELQYLPQRLKQTTLRILQQNIHSLSARKQRGYKTGKLKFKSEFNSIELNEYGTTHKIMKNKKSLKILGIKKHLKVFGLDQLNDKMEFANAKLVLLPDGIHVKLTTYIFPEGKSSQVRKNNVGLDFGIKNNITTSDGETFNVMVEETERLKTLQKKLSRCKRGSNNRYKIKKAIRREYQKMSYQKADKVNKITHYLLTKYNNIVMQDESLHGWHKSYFGKHVQHSAMGSLKKKLSLSPRVIVIDKYLPTTKMCYVCGELNNTIKLSDRIFICEHCGHTEDRDIKAANTILKLGLIQIGMGHTEFTLTETDVDTLKTSVDDVRSQL